MNSNKNFIWNMVGSTVHAFSALIFMIIVTRINGVSEAGIFTLAFSIACLINILAAYEGRTYQVTDISKSISNKDYIYHRYITFIIGIICSVGYVVVMGYSSDKIIITLLLCGMKLLESLGDVYYGISQKNSELYVVGISLTIKAAVSMILFFIIDLLTKNLTISLVVVNIIWITVLVFYDIPKARKYILPDEKIKKSNIKLIFIKGFYSFAVLFLSIYLVNCTKYMLDGRVNESLQAIFGMVLMPATVMSLVSVYIVQPSLNKLSRARLNGNKKEFNKEVIKMLIALCCFGVFSLLVIYFIGTLVLSIIYGIDLSHYRIHLVLIMLGAIFNAISILISSALTTLRRTSVQFLIYVFVSVFGTFTSIILINNFSIMGAALAYLLMMVSQLGLYLIIYMYIINKIDFIEEINTL